MKRINGEQLNLRLEQDAARGISERKTFGLSYLVMQAGETVAKRYFGTADGVAPLRDDHLFRLASMTKPITALATLKLAERGVISLDTRAEEYLPSLCGVLLANEKVPARNPITVWHLLTHTSGLKTCAVTAKDRETALGTIARSVRAGLEFEPGSRQAYNGYVAFDVLAEMLAGACGMPIETILEREIFSPLGMRDTTFSPTDEMWGRLVALHDCIDGESVMGKTVPGCIFEGFPHTHPLAGGGLVSTLTDYGRFAAHLLEHLTAPTVSALRTPQVEKSENEAWGFGVRVITGRHTLPVGTFGWSGAYGSHFWVDPENQIIAIMMKNSRVDGGADNDSAVNFEHAVYDAI